MMPRNHVFFWIFWGSIIDVWRTGKTPQGPIHQNSFWDWDKGLPCFPDTRYTCFQSNRSILQERIQFRVIRTLKHYIYTYSNIDSDMPSGSIYGTFWQILWHSIWYFFCHMYSSWHIFCHSF
jgi:hypothetical protein